MSFSLKVALMMFLFLCPSMVRGLEKPSQEEARKFLEYYYKGQKQGPLLTQIQICPESKDGQKGDDPSCKEMPRSTPKDEQTYLRMTFVVPRETKEELILQLEHGGITRMTREFQVNSAFDYRVFEKVTFNKAGTWTAKVFRTHNGQIEKLGESKIDVVE